MSKFWSSNGSSSSSSPSQSEASQDEDASDFWDSDDDNDDCNEHPNATNFDVIDEDLLNLQDNVDGLPSCGGEGFAAKKALAATKDDPLDPNVVWTQIKNDQVFQEPPTIISQGLPPKQERDYTRFVCMSDTHAKHRGIPFLPPGDVLIHGGDFTKSGEIGTVRDLSDYFGEHAAGFDHIVCIAGNHELTFQPEFYKTAKRRHKPVAFDPYETRAALRNCTYLEDSAIRIGDAFEVYGSPWTPAFYGWAFNLPRGQSLGNIWSRIPAVDVLVTHGPPLGRGDFTDHSGRSGCRDLLEHVQKRIRPRLHVFGHIHQSYGTTFDGQTLFVNASNLDSDTCEAAPHRPVVVVDVPHDPTLPAQVVKPNIKVRTNDELLRWLEKKTSYSCLSDAVIRAGNPCQEIFLEDVFAKKSAFTYLCGALELHRNKEARKDLSLALRELYAEFFSI